MTPAQTVIKVACVITVMGDRIPDIIITHYGEHQMLDEGVDKFVGGLTDGCAI